jgi:hypothetical protein
MAQSQILEDLNLQRDLYSRGNSAFIVSIEVSNLGKLVKNDQERPSDCAVPASTAFVSDEHANW